MVVVGDWVVAVEKEETTATSVAIVVGDGTGVGGLCANPTPNVNSAADAAAMNLGIKSIAFS